MRFWADSLSSGVQFQLLDVEKGLFLSFAPLHFFPPSPFPRRLFLSLLSLFPFLSLSLSLSFPLPSLSPLPLTSLSSSLPILPSPNLPLSFRRPLLPHTIRPCERVSLPSSVFMLLYAYFFLFLIEQIGLYLKPSHLLSSLGGSLFTTLL